MSLREILEHRRATRIFDKDKEIDKAAVKDCIEQAMLTPTSSNMQLWETYHITDAEVLKQISTACLSQVTARTAKQMVVFVTRQDKYKAHAKEILNFERENIKRSSPADRVAHRTKNLELYYNKLMPFVYSRGLGLIGLFRKSLMMCVGLFRPILRQVSEQDIRVVVQKSCGMVAETFMIAMSEKGYDTCPVEGFDCLRIKRILNLPSSCEINMVVTCGVRSDKGVFGDRFRLPFNEFYHEV